MSGDISGAARGLARHGWTQRASWGAGVAGLLLLAGCSGAGGGQAAAVRPPATVTITSGNLTFSSAATAAKGAGRDHRAGAAVLTSPAATGAGALDTRPDLGVAVSVRDGTLSQVVVRNAAGAAVPGSYAAGSRAWRTGWALVPGQTYQVTATAVNPAGRRTVAAGMFRTFRPQRGFTATTTLTPGETVGVGMPIMVTFSQPVRDRAAVERSLEVWSSKPVTGAWYWMDSKDVWFRPEYYWPAHDQVRFTAHLAGVQGAPGVYGRANLSQHFQIGSALIARANTATHHMKVWWNGRLLGNWPISTGRPGMDTADGNYLSFAMANPVDMNSATIGIPAGSPGYYNELVYDAVQFTASGTYIHSAPWSVAEQGIVNVSHGCVNVGPANAVWYYNHSMLGDPISVVGSPQPGTWGNGWTIYFLGWRKLLAGSATGEAVQAGSQGSRFVTASVTQAPAAAAPSVHQRAA
ncbi:MAG: Ig-like domain-containing protein [Streptosporangiales bacterium]